MLVIVILPALILGVEAYRNKRISQNESGSLISSGRLSIVGIILGVTQKLMAIMNRTVGSARIICLCQLVWDCMFLSLRGFCRKGMHVWLPVGLIILASLLSIDPRLQDYWTEQKFMATAYLKSIQ